MKTVAIKIVFDEMWYIVEYFIINIFYFLIVSDREQPRARIIFIHHAQTVQKIRQIKFLFIK